MSTVTQRRLAGIAVDTRTAAAGEVLPRMDVALFAGVAASGPVGVPVAVEDVAQFTAVFGDDAPLAWDSRLGRTAVACLGGAVRAFFANGGRRCWVLRLAGTGAAVNALPVPGVAVLEGTALAPLVLRARSPGSWSDDVLLAATLTSRSYLATAWDGVALVLDAGRQDAIAPGDLLRLTWSGTATAVYVPVVGVEPAEASGAAQALTVRCGTGVQLDDPPADPDLSGRLRLASGPLDGAELEPATRDDGLTTLVLPGGSPRPRPGDIVVADAAGGDLLLAVQEVVLADAAGGAAGAVRVRGAARWHASSPTAPAGLPRVERLGLALWARIGSQDALRLDDLGLAPGHPRHVDLLPADELLYATTDWTGDAWRDALAPRFPAAGSPGGSPRLCIPLGAATLPEHYLPAILPEGEALERDGLVPWEPAIFTDEALAGSRASTLIEDAEYLRLFAPVPRELRGIQRALEIEEATLLVLPDAVLPGWEEPTDSTPAFSTAAAPPPSSAGGFEVCGTLPPGPGLQAALVEAEVQLSWTAVPGAGTYQLQEATREDWADAAEVYAGSECAATLTGRSTGEYRYRVRGDASTQWSNVVVVSVAAGSGWSMRPPARFTDDVLLAAHRLALRFCAARRDVLAVLALPEHYDDGAALAHATRLASAGAPEIALYAAQPSGPAIPPLSGRENEAPAFAALYHGWVYAQDADGIARALPPDGPMAGCLARRATDRGAWVAPANVPLQGIVAVERPVPRERWQALLDAQVNLVRQTPRGFMALSADTLAAAGAVEVRPINVRRLLALLRRLALREGATYVFEPNNAAFRRMVQRGFEALLGDLFQRGAFAGDSAATAFQVVTDESVNPPASVDAGRFIVELRVAPSRPLAFLTVRLVSTGAGVTVTGA